MHGSHTHTHTPHIHNTTSGYESARTNTSNEQTRRTKSSLAHLQGVFDRMDSEFISQQPLAAHKKQQQSPERPLQKQRVQFAFRLSRTTTRTNGKNRNCSRARGLNCTKNRGSPIPLLDGFYLNVIDVHFQRRTNALIYSSKSSSQSCCPQIERSCSGLQESQIRHHNELFQNEKELPGRRNTYRDLPPRRRWSAAKLLRTCRIR